MPYKPFEVQGLGELNAALKGFAVDVRKELRKEVAVAAEPVARTAERLTFNEITGMKRQKTVNWSKMRVGATAGATFVYIAPKQRSRKRGGRARRPNLANLIKPRMESAARKNIPVVVSGITKAMNNAIRKAGL